MSVTSTAASAQGRDQRVHVGPNTPRLLEQQTLMISHIVLTAVELRVERQSAQQGCQAWLPRTTVVPRPLERRSKRPISELSLPAPRAS
eukprot:3990225-Heterocapsa_arctica.AAC.1